ncbi:MAG: bifunctional 3-deoxy-7-phosphoheptulonate synthase/chorismate mutase [Chloroflexota bacterium]
MPANRMAELRAEIDDINMQLLELLNKRATVASEIGKIQSSIGSQIYDPQRESQMLTALQMANEGPFSNETISGLFKEIFKATLNLEEKEARANFLVQRKTPDQNTVIEMPDGTRIGNSDFQVIAGPCAIESYEQYDEVASALVDEGIKIMRAMAYKPRTSPYDFQGLGEPGLKIARQVANKYGLMLVSEVLDQSQLPMMDDYVDMFWIGARNMQNAFLLRAVGKMNKPVVLKRHFGATLKEFIYAAEYIMSEGNSQIILMERGIRTFSQWTRNTLDIGAVPLLKQETHLPVIVDVSHSAGRRDLAIPFARVAKASGADGMMVEVHPNPSVAMSDAKQQLDIPQFRQLMQELRKINTERDAEPAGD